MEVNLVSLTAISACVALFFLCVVSTVNNCLAVRAVVFGFHKQVYFLKPKVSFTVNYAWSSIVAKLLYTLWGGS